MLSATKKAFTAVLAAVLMVGCVVKEGYILTAEDEELLSTRTTNPQPSPQLVHALGLGIAPWHRKDLPPVPQSKIGDAAGRQSTEAALKALNELDATVPQNDFDRAWVAYERADALKALGRNAEAVDAFETLLLMPQTQYRKRKTYAALNGLGLKQYPTWCASEFKRILPPKNASVELPVVALRGIEGVVYTLADVRADGSVENVFIVQSSMRYFERPMIELVRDSRWLNKQGSPPGKVCFAWVPTHFKMQAGRPIQYSVVNTGFESGFTYRSIQKAIDVRAAARAELLNAAESEKQAVTPHP